MFEPLLPVLCHLAAAVATIWLLRREVSEILANPARRPPAWVEDCAPLRGRWLSLILSLPLLLLLAVIAYGIVFTIAILVLTVPAAFVHGYLYS
jgi:hypothetical protein